MLKWFSKHRVQVGFIISVIIMAVVIWAIEYEGKNPNEPSSSYWITAAIGLATLLFVFISLFIITPTMSTSSPEFSEEQNAFNILRKREKAMLRWSHRGKGTIIVRGSEDIADWLIEITGPSSEKHEQTVKPLGGQLYAAIFQYLKPGSYMIKHPDVFKKAYDEEICKQVVVRAGKIEEVDWRTRTPDDSLRFLVL